MTYTEPSERSGAPVVLFGAFLNCAKCAMESRMIYLRILLLALLLPLTGSCSVFSGGGEWNGVEMGASRKGSNKPAHRRSKKIVIDPGHGGDDYGTNSIEKPRYHEKYLALATALMVRDHLTKMGYQVVMTRTSDVAVSLSDRAAVANKRKADLFVSMHFNSAPSRKAQGVEVFFYDSRKDQSRAGRSKLFAQRVLTQVTNTTKMDSRGVKAGNFSVIRNADMPAILVEGGFLTNKDEMQRLKDPKMLNKIAWGVAKGIDEYLQ